MEYDSALSKKAENSDTCDNMDEPWRHYEVNQASHQNMLYDSIYRRYRE